MVWRHLRKGEIDHELIWLSVSLAGAAMVLLWLHLGLPHPLCTFHAITGFACPTCGATRCVRHALEGSLTAAFLVNPLFFAFLVALVLYDLYALAVVVFRWPRLRLSARSPRTTWIIRGSVVLVFFANWIWLIVRGV
ncbi:MAG: DUF2752 domain-containing protein [Chthoniobacteraceae bacterium]